MFEKSTFKNAYFFEGQALGTATAYTGKVMELGNLQQALKVVGTLDTDIACSSGNSISMAVQVADDADSTAWTTMKSSTATATGTKIDANDSFLVVPVDSAKGFMRVTVACTTGMTGKFSIAEEYAAR